MQTIWVYKSGKLKAVAAGYGFKRLHHIVFSRGGGADFSSAAQRAWSSDGK
jgi:hypothetical protein